MLADLVMRIFLEAGPLNLTLRAFSEQTNVQILYDANDSPVRTHRVDCICTPDTAIALLLEDTKLTYSWSDAFTVTVHVMPHCGPDPVETSRPCLSDDGPYLLQRNAEYIGMLSTGYSTAAPWPGFD